MKSPTAHTHSRLLHAIIVEGNTSKNTFFPKGPIVIIHEEKTWSGITSNIDIRPSILIEIGCDYRHPIFLTRAANPGLLGNIGESAIAIVLIQHMASSESRVEDRGVRN